MKKITILVVLVIGLASCGTYSTTPQQTAEQMEKAEYDELMKQDSINKHAAAAESLDVLLNEDPKDKRVSLIIKNTTNCNIIVRFAGEKFYNLPIPKNGKNFIVLQKGSYSLGANLCKTRYSSMRDINESITLTLSERQ